MTTFFDGEIISIRYPFLTRKWDADEEVDRKHWVTFLYKYTFYKIKYRRIFYLFYTFRTNFNHFQIILKHLIMMILILTNLKTLIMFL